MPEKFNTTILIAPLDWGLGHATRCIPIIRHLLQLGCKVLIASNGPQQQLLSREFPGVPMLTVPNYNIHYSKSKRWFNLKIIAQVPKLFQVIYTEKTWVSNLVKKYKIDAIISDNRYGFRHDKVPSVIITHQLEIQTPRMFMKGAQLVNYWLISRFSACWVPDFKQTPGLGGNLSHPAVMPSVPVQYLGALSRLLPGLKTDPIYDLLVIISGPEPQRTILEGLLLTQLKSYTERVLFIRGLPGISGESTGFNNVNIVNHLPSDQLNEAILASRYVISRSGYTTVMDLVALRSRAILIPTPGQTEQEYLAQHLHQQNWFCAISQADFTLEKAVKLAAKFPFKYPHTDMNTYKKVVTGFVQSLIP